MSRLWARLIICTAIGLIWSPNGYSQSDGSVKEHLRILSPPSVEPRPIVVWASGCSGFFHPRAPWHNVERTQSILAAGYAIAYVDYVAAFGVESACAGELSLSEIASVLIEAVTSLGERDEIDPEHVVLLGSSLGGGGVLATLAETNPVMNSVKGVLSIYPACEGLVPWDSPAPVWVWFAGGDLIQPPSQCRNALDSSEGIINERVFADVHHGFDTRGLPTELKPGEAALAYDPAAADALWRDIETVLEALR